MISWILCIILAAWCIYQRTQEGGNVEGQPLGMPRGTVRAYITILIVAFPFSYLIIGEPIPSLVINALFLLVAFYFQARKGSQDRIKQVVSEVINPEKAAIAAQEEKKPLYFPKYTVRTTIISLLILSVLLNSIGPQLPFEATNSFTDLFLIITFFIIGSLFGALVNSSQRKKIHEKVKKMADYKTTSKYEILEKLYEEKISWWKKTGENLLSIFIIGIVLTALFCYTFSIAPVLITLVTYELTLPEALLLFISVYYGIRN